MLQFSYLNIIDKAMMHPSKIQSTIHNLLSFVQSPQSMSFMKFYGLGLTSQGFGVNKIHPGGAHCHFTDRESPKNDQLPVISDQLTLVDYDFQLLYHHVKLR